MCLVRKNRKICATNLYPNSTEIPRKKRKNKPPRDRSRHAAAPGPQDSRRPPNQSIAGRPPGAIAPPRTCVSWQAPPRRPDTCGHLPERTRGSDVGGTANFRTFFSPPPTARLFVYIRGARGE